MSADFVVVPQVAWRELKIPVHLAGVGVVGDSAVGVEIVARSMEWIEHRHRIASAPDGLIGSGIVGAGHPHSTASGLPRIGIALPGLAAGLAGGWDSELAPEAFAGGGIEPGYPVAYTLVAVGGADDDLVLDGEWRRREGHVRRIRE